MALLYAEGVLIKAQGREALRAHPGYTDNHYSTLKGLFRRLQTRGTIVTASHNNPFRVGRFLSPFTQGSSKTRNPGL